MPAVREYLTPKLYVDQAIFYNVSQSSLVRVHPEEKLKLDEQDSIILNSILTSPKTTIELPTKSYVDSLHESSRNRQDLSSVINDQHTEFENIEITILDSISIKKNPILDKEVSIKKIRR